MDVQTRVEDTVALAAYVQCLVKQILDEIDAGPAGGLQPDAAVGEQMAGRALRAGCAADGPGGRQAIKMAARTLARRRLRELRPIARELSCAHHLARVEWMIENGTGAQRQLQVWNANRDLHEVAEELADATEAV